MSKPRILIAEDEKDIRELLEYSLGKEGYKVKSAPDGNVALRLAEEYVPDIFILDVMMPGMDGIELCRKLRENAKFDNSFIVILTARSEEYSEVAGFDAGADDYIAKPVKLRSLIRRLEALQRRSLKNDPEFIEVGPFRIDKDKYLVYSNGEEIVLPRKEFELVYLLASYPNKVVSRDKIFQQIWGKEVIVLDRTIDVHIRRLRKKIGEDFIKTVKGVGYKFSIEE